MRIATPRTAADGDARHDKHLAPTGLNDRPGGAAQPRSASAGIPIGATRILPSVLAAPRRVRSPVFGRWKVTVRSARTAGVRRLPAREIDSRRGVDGDGPERPTHVRERRPRQPSGSARAGRPGHPCRAAHQRGQLPLDAEAEHRHVPGDRQVDLDGYPRRARYRSQLRAAVAPFGRASAATIGEMTDAPARARRRAATKPSPPLLPGPHRMTIGPLTHRPRSAASTRTRGCDRCSRMLHEPLFGVRRGPGHDGPPRSSSRQRWPGARGPGGPMPAQGAQVHVRRSADRRRAVAERRRESKAGRSRASPPKRSRRPRSPRCGAPAIVLTLRPGMELRDQASGRRPLRLGVGGPARAGPCPPTGRARRLDRGRPVLADRDVEGDPVGAGRLPQAIHDPATQPAGGRCRNGAAASRVPRVGAAPACGTPGTGQARAGRAAQSGPRGWQTIAPISISAWVHAAARSRGSA